MDHQAQAIQIPSREAASGRISLAARCLILFVRIYQATLGHFMGGHCRFQPTCSHYAIEALRAHGPWRGSWLTIRRIARCHPFGGSGIDPVPEGRLTTETTEHTEKTRKCCGED